MKPKISEMVGGVDVKIYGEKLIVKNIKKVGENETKILDLICRNNNITYVELANKIGVTEKSIYINIEKLKQKKLLKRIGPAKGGY